MASLSLGDLGERRVIAELLGRRYGQTVSSFGDDSAVLSYSPSKQDHLVITTDPCPEPAAHIAGFPDEYYRGWLLATINLSDIAAAGAEPLALVTSLVLPSQMRISEFDRLLDGVDECCRLSGTRVIGGNLKEGSKIEVSATAIGVCRHGRPLSRKGTRPGDALVIVGHVGGFWAAFAAIRRGLSPPAEWAASFFEPLLTPPALLREGQVIRSLGFATACMDNSDGLFPALETLRIINGCGFNVDFSQYPWNEYLLWTSSKLRVDPVRFALGWGDWNLVVTVPKEQFPLLSEALGAQGLGPAVQIGSATDSSSIDISHNGIRGRMKPIDSQRFAPDSWFTSGIAGYESMLLEGPLTA